MTKFRTARLRARGQVTIPKEMRKALGVVAGDILIWSVEDGKVIVSKAVTVFPNRVRRSIEKE